MGSDSISRQCPELNHRTVLPNLFGTRDPFHGRQFFHGLGGKGWFRDDSSALHLFCTLFLLLLHQIHLRSSGIRTGRLGTPCCRTSGAKAELLGVGKILIRLESVL